MSVSLACYFVKKSGMTRIFSEDGQHVPVTVLELIPNVITQVKTKEKDGYLAYQVSYGEKRKALLSAPRQGHLQKSGTELSLNLSAEIIDENVKLENLGMQVSTDLFKPQSMVDITGTSKGKGFQGVVKRHHFAGGPAAHGSGFHRTSGSIGNRAIPGRVWKGKKMPGHLGVDTVTVKNITVVELNQEKKYMLVKGSVPGGKNSFLKVSLTKA